MQGAGRTRRSIGTCRVNDYAAGKKAKMTKPNQVGPRANNVRLTERKLSVAAVILTYMVTLENAACTWSTLGWSWKQTDCILMGNVCINVITCKKQKQISTLPYYLDNRPHYNTDYRTYQFIEILLYIRNECARMHLWHLNMEKQPQFRERNEGY